MEKTRTEKYERYLRSKEWRELKAYLIERRGLKCEICGKIKKDPRQVNIHHITYKRLFNELPADLLILCIPCHKKQHPGCGGGKNRKKSSALKKKKVNHVFIALQQIEMKKQNGQFENNAQFLKERSKAVKKYSA